MKASGKTEPPSSPAAVKPTVTAACPARKDRYHLPSHDALAQILPGYRYLAKDARTDLHNATRQGQERRAQGAGAARAKKNNINHTFQVHHSHKRPLLHDFERDPIVAEVTDLQTKEVENYRSAMSKMAQDIIALRTQLVTVEAENSRLRSDLSLHQDLGRDLLDDTDIAVMTRAEVADRIASLKFKLASETSKVASQRDRIQQLQNELIKKNDREQELLKLTRVQQQQQEEDLQLHRGHVAKTATLEATVKQQEMVIEKMERAIESKLGEKKKQRGDKSVALDKNRGKTDCRADEMERALVAENSQFREELDKIGRQTFPVTAQESAQTKEVLPLKERLSLLNKLQKAEARVQILEAQLQENASLWGRQKQEMLIRLSEHRHGFVRTSTTILHNLSLVS